MWSHLYSSLFCCWSVLHVLCMLEVHQYNGITHLYNNSNYTFTIDLAPTRGNTLRGPIEAFTVDVNVDNSSSTRPLDSGAS